MMVSLEIEDWMRDGFEKKSEYDSFDAHLQHVWLAWNDKHGAFQIVR